MIVGNFPYTSTVTLSGKAVVNRSSNRQSPLRLVLTVVDVVDVQDVSADEFEIGDVDVASEGRQCSVSFHVVLSRKVGL